MEFPVLLGDSKNYPDIQKANCPVCKSKKVWGDDEYVEFSGGAVPTEKNEYVCDLWLDWFSQKNKMVRKIILICQSFAKLMLRGFN